MIDYVCMTRGIVLYCKQARDRKGGNHGSVQVEQHGITRDVTATAPHKRRSCHIWDGNVFS